MHAIILVGGRGTRLQPLTDTRPKPMLPILGRPFLEHQLAHLKAHGVTAVTFACGFLPSQIVSHFGEGDDLGMKLTYVIEPQPLDTAGAIAFAARTLEPQRLLVCNGDVLTDMDISRLVAEHERLGAAATIALTPVDDPTRYGLVRTGERDAVLAFLEKPTLEEAGEDRYINAGTYVLEPEVIAMVPQGVRCNIEREIFPALVGKRLHAIGFDGYWNDIGTPASYLAANIDLLDDASGNWVHDSARVHPGATVGPGAIVGEGAVVADGAVVERSVLLEHVVVGRGATVRDSIVGERAVIADGQQIADDVVAPGSAPESAQV
ncbi:MAG: GDP-mannose pyrophosphorylase [Thermoleophilia bacterium]|jgi:mannose-1-phosphate guanylyltransferase|nr:GDP-mannose pyrophosphorylase [Thermoleophilia bacterium]